MPAGQGLPSSGVSQTDRAHRLWAVPTARTGGMAYSAIGDVMGEWQQCHAGREIFARYGALWPRLTLDLGEAGRAVATPCLIVLMGAQTLRALGAAC